MNKPNIGWKGKCKERGIDTSMVLQQLSGRAVNCQRCPVLQRSGLGAVISTGVHHLLFLA